MKIWIKYTIAIILGVIIAVFIPATPEVKAVFASLADFFTQIGVFAVFPLLITSMVIGTYQLKLDGLLLKIYGKTALLLMGITLLLVIVGAIIVFILSPKLAGDQQIIGEGNGFTQEVSTISQNYISFFPKNLYSLFIGIGKYLLTVLLLPGIIIAFILGVNLTFDRVNTRPVVQLFDSLSRVFYHILSLIVEVFWFAFIVLSINFIVQLNLSGISLNYYSEVILIISFVTSLVIFGILPPLVYLFDGNNNPYKIIYAGIAAAITGFLSGSNLLAVMLLTKQGNENLKIPREASSAVYSLFAVFGRAGTALISCIAFFVIVNTYVAATEINLLIILYIIAFSFLFSFTVGTVPVIGTYLTISLLCAQFNAFWPNLLKATDAVEMEPIKLLLSSFSVLLDTIIAHLGSYLVCRQEKLTKLAEMSDFI